MKTLFVAFNHGTLNTKQLDDLDRELEVTKVVYLSEVNQELQRKFSNVPASWDTENRADLARRIVESAQKTGANFIYAAGEYATCFLIQYYATDLHVYVDKQGQEIIGEDVNGCMTFIVPTTERVSKDEIQPDGSVKKTSIFQHVCWIKI